MKIIKLPIWVVVAVSTIVTVYVIGSLAYITDRIQSDNLTRCLNESEQVATKYFKEKENVEIEIKSQLVTRGFLTTCDKGIVEGHVKGNENQKIKATVTFDGIKVEKVTGKIVNE
ncbi:hypothetical protein [Bacillus gaemokensis]|uniref:Uncharacterized protein n=1 Tax=Bacillus gaemokensis TaxID=574375 RepID=A0A073K5U2_9BACI|nr:hypothetical protein [Bacillus gaemokensis]KEK21901.1 hypothetical protein BAGA_23320 [Bacillus gaemokensis]KYG36553.1 hypothetical protein AZF08_25465 [Bacillus gaemokensis]